MNEVFLTGKIISNVEFKFIINSKNISIAIKTNEEIEEFTLSGKTVEFDGIIYYNNIELISISYNDILDQYVIICKEEPIDDYS